MNISKIVTVDEKEHTYDFELPTFPCLFSELENYCRNVVTTLSSELAVCSVEHLQTAVQNICTTLTMELLSQQAIVFNDADTEKINPLRFVSIQHSMDTVANRCIINIQPITKPVLMTIVSTVPYDKAQYYEDTIKSILNNQYSDLKLATFLASRICSIIRARLKYDAQPLGYCVAARNNSTEMSKLDAFCVNHRNSGDLLSVKDYEFIDQATEVTTDYVVAVSCLFS